MLLDPAQMDWSKQSDASVAMAANDGIREAQQEAERRHMEKNAE